MSLEIYLISAGMLLVFSGLLAMADLGAAFLFVPLFYYLGAARGRDYAGRNF